MGRFECPVCHRPMMGPDEACSGSFTERDHPSNVRAVQVAGPSEADLNAPATPEDGSPQDPRFTAALTLLRRMGTSEIQVRYDEEQAPIFWLVVGKWGDTYEADTALTPLRAAVRLAERVGDGGTWAYCTKPTAVSDDWRSPTILEAHYCWWVYDPETNEFRRSCAAEHPEKQLHVKAPVGRNDLCPCGSGKKFKRCCGGGS